MNVIHLSIIIKIKGDKQLLTKMKNFWEYLMPDGDRKAKKAIHKSNKLETYQAAVRSLLG